MIFDCTLIKLIRYVIKPFVYFNFNDLIIIHMGNIFTIDKQIKNH